MASKTSHPTTRPTQMTCSPLKHHSGHTPSRFAFTNAQGTLSPASRAACRRRDCGAICAYNKLSDIRRPSPSDVFTFADEHADSLNDGWLITDMTNPNMWNDVP